MPYCVNVHHSKENCREAGLPDYMYCSGCRIVLLKPHDDRPPRTRTEATRANQLEIGDNYDDAA